MVQFVILLRIGIAPGADALQADVVIQVPVGDQAGALVLGFVLPAKVRDHRVGIPDIGGILAEVVQGAAGGGHDGQGVEQLRLPALVTRDRDAFLWAHVLLGLGPVQVQVQCECLCRGIAGLPDNVLAVLVHVLVAVIDVLDIAVAVYRGAGQAGPHRVREGHVDHEVAVGAVVVAEATADGKIKFVFGSVGGEHQRTARGVLAKQGALGAPQNLHRLYIVDIEQGAVGAPDVHLVDIDPHAGVDIGPGIALPDTADIDIGQGRGAVGRGHLDIRRDLVQVGEVAHTRVAQRIGTEGGHGHRGLLQALLAFAGGHYNFFQHVALGKREGHVCRQRDGCDQGG